MIAGRVVLALGLLALVAAPDASARTKRGDGPVVRYPSELTEIQLRLLLQSNDDPATIVIEKGTYLFDPQLFVFDRSNVTICGASRRAGDTVIEGLGGGAGAGGNATVRLEQTQNVAFRNLTIRNSAGNGEALRLNAVLNSEFDGFARTTTVTGCRLEANFPVVATARATDLVLDRCSVVVTRDPDSPLLDSIGVLWGDGEGLQVTRTKFTTEAGVPAVSALFVAGALANFSEGERARGVILTRNRITGDFRRGFDLADVVGARVARNRFAFSGAPIQEASDTGRVGILLRRGAASSLPADYELRRNRVRNAMYGAWLVTADQGVLARNDFRKCGSRTPDGFFNETGGALRLTLQSANCRINIERNDFRNLRADLAAPAVTVLPGALSGACFADGDGGNRLSPGRALFEGAP